MKLDVRIIHAILTKTKQNKNIYLTTFIIQETNEQIGRRMLLIIRSLSYPVDRGSIIAV